MSTELISVIMPAYNAEKYIERSIVSVMQQSYQNVELVVVDDGSKDHTIDVIQKCVDRCPDRIRLAIRNQNGGTAAALNDAIDLAEGEYICWLSADDMYYNDMVESELSWLKQNPVYDAVFSRCAFIDENDRLLREMLYNSYADLFAEGMAGIIALLLRANFWNGCSVLARSVCFKQSERFNVKYRGAQDYDFWLRMAADYNIGYLDKVNVLSREHSEQGSRTINCYLDEIRVFFDLLCREDRMIKLYRKMKVPYTYENIRPYIEYRLKKYAGLEKELIEISKGMQKYMNMMQDGRIHYEG